MNRRRFLRGGALSTCGLFAGCPGVLEGDEPPSPDAEKQQSMTGERPAHWVSVYLQDREATREVTVTIRNEPRAVLFERAYRLSDSNEADEDARFPASTDPSTVAVTVDGPRFDEEWPGFHPTQAKCHDKNWEGVEIWVSGAPANPRTSCCRAIASTSPSSDSR